MKILKELYYNKYSKKSFSISSVDLIIGRLFSNFNCGIYLDIGCNHPIKYNNTYLLYKKGWKGINVDLDSESIKQFNLMRKNDHNVNVLVTSKDNEEKDLYFYHKRSAINTISKVLAEKRDNKPKKIKKLKGVSINTIINDSPFQNKKINLLSIDIENYEFEALKEFNFAKYNIDVIVSEVTDIDSSKFELYNNSLEKITNSKIYELLTRNNYKLINWVNSDLVFVNKNSKF
mgnify:FL=1